MGTNYYLEEKAPCSTCGREFERLHIGKSSGGWVFSLQAMPDLGINDLPDWMERWVKPGARIFDEYGKQIEPRDMLITIMARVGKPDKEFDAHWLAENQAVAGPFGLARCRPGPDCKHGSGTYDIHIRDFS